MEWTIAESAVISKTPIRDSEDRLVLTEGNNSIQFAAVVDGATDKSGRDYGGVSGGALAADIVADVLRAPAPDTSPFTTVTRITAALAKVRRHHNIGESDPLAPNAVAAVFIPDRHEVWRVGDVHFAVHSDSGWHEYPAEKKIDRVVAGIRAAYLHCLLARGVPAADLVASDPGRAMVLPVLREQGRLANLPGPYGYGLLNGTDVPPRFVEVIPLDSTADEVVLATDGYLSPAPTLADAEAALAASLAEDPLRINEYPATKGILPGASTFDDRTYLRLVRKR
ncbi:hypothetical protein [Streptomyces sp. NPDC051014]|uniref:hypothetical protein n=1 Tax=Streptomyces sp. NPDC051014 TaxID=3155751 RepID=UPI0033CA14CD